MATPAPKIYPSEAGVLGSHEILPDVNGTDYPHRTSDKDPYPEARSREDRVTRRPMRESPAYSDPSSLEIPPKPSRVSRRFQDTVLWCPPTSSPHIRSTINRELQSQKLLELQIEATNALGVSTVHGPRSTILQRERYQNIVRVPTWLSLPSMVNPGGR